MSQGRRVKVVDGRPWYEDGLRFTCTRCGDCCRRAPGEEKHVYLDAEDLARLEHALGLSRAELLRRHVDRLDEVTLVLKWSETQCSFLGPDGCNVYRNIKFPPEVYEHIQQYYEQKAGADSGA